MSRLRDFVLEYWKPILVAALGLLAWVFTRKNLTSVIQRWEEDQSIAEKMMQWRKQQREEDYARKVAAKAVRDEEALRRLDRVVDEEFERLQQDAKFLDSKRSDLLRRFGGKSE